jgi:hypothetical protein
MSYLERVLQPSEQVRHISSIHWIVYWPSVAVALLAVAAYWLGGKVLERANTASPDSNGLGAFGGRR